MLTIKDLWKINKTSKRTPFLGTTSTLSSFEFMNEYVGNYTHFDRMFARTRGCFSPVWNLNEEEDEIAVLDAFKEDILAMLYAKRDNYQRLYDIQKATYSPLENYRMVEQGVDSTQDSANGSETIGAGKVTNKYGEVDSTQVNGAVTSNVTNQTSGFNNGLNDRDKSTSNIGSQTNTNLVEEHTDEITEDARTNSNSLQSSSLVNHNLTRSGNIGVTTSQQMAQSEIDLWGAYNFYLKLFDDIIKEFCILGDEGVDAFDEGFHITGVTSSKSNIRAYTEETPDGAMLIVSDSYGTTRSNLKNGKTPDFKLEDGDLYVNYD